MKQFAVTGMSCAACSARVEKAVSKVEGVSSVSVSLLTNTLLVEGEADSAEIIKAVEAAGYGATEKNKLNIKGNSAEKTPEDKETRVLGGAFVIITCINRDINVFFHGLCDVELAHS